jgi:valyl-tRNA synthetase
MGEARLIGRLFAGTFTLDAGLNKAVKHVFVTLYNEGLIYQGERIINWDPELRTALSNIEIIHKDDEGEFFYFKYDVVGTQEDRRRDDPA